jgi:hypothetical protein
VLYITKVFFGKDKIPQEGEHAPNRKALEILYRTGYYQGEYTRKIEDFSPALWPFLALRNGDLTNKAGPSTEGLLTFLQQILSFKIPL